MTEFWHDRQSIPARYLYLSLLFVNYLFGYPQSIRSISRTASSIPMKKTLLHAKM